MAKNSSDPGSDAPKKIYSTIQQMQVQDLYADGFINHFILPLVYPPGLTRPGQIFLGLVVIAINIALYASCFFRKKKAKARK